MKTFAIVLAAGLVAVTQAQEQCAAVAAKIPTCAVSCISTAAAKAGCGMTDFACQCKPANTAAINSAALECVLSGCGAATGLAVQASASAVCACAASAGPVAASSTAATAPASTSAVATSSAAVVASTAPATSSAPFPVTTSATASGVASAPPVASTGGVTTSSTAPFLGAGVRAIASIGGVFGAFVAVMAVL
ncbi:hypothetical protein ABVK25_006432 [Lepraria finkii]|uniref:CFEM domain-containing protein n=1 Tax=Lepraria finkii TaxID=1340010 RepID=A0ABR4BC21_9LECA